MIEGVNDGDAVEDLLQENNVTLARAIVKFHSKEAAKKHCSDIAAPELKFVATLVTLINQPITHHQHAQDVKQPHIEEGITNAQHTTKRVPTATRLAISQRYVCEG